MHIKDTTLDSIDQALGLEREPVTIDQETKEIVVDNVKKASKELKGHKKHRDSDFEKARSSIANMMKIAEDAIESAGTIVRENPAYLFQFIEVMTPLIKNISGSAKDLLELQKMMDDLEGKANSVKEPEGDVTNNNFFVGSTADLAQMLKDENSRQALMVDSDDED